MKRAVPAAMLLTLLASACGPAAKPVTAVPADGMSWESIQQLPDLSGWWRWDYLATHDFSAGGLGNLPLKPEILDKAKQAGQRFFAGITPGARAEDATFAQSILGAGYCLPPHFLGVNAGMGIGGSQEFLFTPGRVTVLDESGLVRRIALNVPLPTEVAESSAGASVGHWDGQTLVVETTGFDSEWRLGAEKIGRNVRSIERISLKEPGVLQIALTLTVPDLFTAPFEHTYIFRRDPEHQFTEFSTCKAQDRSVDPVTHQNRFDTTPPPDLPPPPKD